MGFMDIEKIVNVRLQGWAGVTDDHIICSKCCVCLINKTHGYTQIPPDTNLEKLLKLGSTVAQSLGHFATFFCSSNKT